jgi:BASS family bile acid:Na+ symporter
MDFDFFINTVLPLALSLIMLGLGMTLRVSDFTRVFAYPKAAAVGLLCQMVLLPLTGFALAKLFPLAPMLAVGVMILACCPAGASSNLITYLSRGDVALAVTLTAVTSFAAVFTAPILINLSLQHFMGEGQAIQLPLLKTIIQISRMIVIPVIIGMLINAWKPDFTKALESPMRILSTLVLAMAVFGTVWADKANLVSNFQSAGVVMLCLNVLTLLIGYNVARLFRLHQKQAITVSIEGGIQNGTLAIVIAATILQTPAMAVPAAVYSLIMFATGGFMIYYFGGKMKRAEVSG